MQAFPRNFRVLLLPKRHTNKVSDETEAPQARVSIFGRFPGVAEAKIRVMEEFNNRGTKRVGSEQETAKASQSGDFLAVKRSHKDE